MESKPSGNGAASKLASGDSYRDNTTAAGGYAPHFSVPNRNETMLRHRSNETIGR